MAKPLYYPASLAPQTIYLLKDGFSHHGVMSRHQQPFIAVCIGGEVQPDYLSPVFKSIQCQPIVCDLRGLTDLRDGLFTEIDPVKLLNYKIVSWPSELQSNQSVSFCGNGVPV
jgi:hypothetical protein